jgi:hypothetical protein
VYNLFINAQISRLATKSLSSMMMGEDMADEIFNTNQNELESYYASDLVSDADVWLYACEARFMKSNTNKLVDRIIFLKIRKYQQLERLIKIRKIFNFTLLHFLTVCFKNKMLNHIAWHRACNEAIDK